MLSVLALTLLAHVPTYDNCVDNCCVPPKRPDISQVMYLKGSGGFELHLEDLAPDTTLDVDAVFRDAVDQTTYSIHVGCGGCLPSDPLVTPPLVLSGYGPVEIEPFTQTSYRSALSASDRTFDTSRLTNCSEGHFTLRLVDHRPDRDAPIVWGAVIGLGESFSALELVQFPVYVLRNHGTVWNDLGWTFWVILFVGAPLYLYAGRTLYRRCCGCYIPSASGSSGAREWCYELAMIGFTAAALETLTHLVYVQVGHPVESAFWIGLVAVVALANGIPMGFVFVVWYGMRRPRACGGCLADPRWAPLEIATGISFLFLLGSGLYVGPAGVVAGGVLRLREMTSTTPEPPKQTPSTESVARPRGYAAEGTTGRRLRI